MSQSFRSPTIPGQFNSQFVLQAKYSKDLDDIRTIEKLEIERHYWQSKGIPWQIITEKDIPMDIQNNIKWLYPIGYIELYYNQTRIINHQDRCGLIIIVSLRN